jgi:methionyl-tRNA synthetase
LDLQPIHMNTHGVVHGGVLFTLAETVRHIALLTQPYMPDASARILDPLAVSPYQRGFTALESGVLKPGTELPPPVGVFPRIVEPTTGDKAGEGAKD